LLATQILILFLQAWIFRDLWHGTGLLAVRRPAAGRVLNWISFVYVATMALRYMLTMWWFPERRWLHGTIPIFFHLVLAAYLYVLGKYYMSEDELLTVTGEDSELLHDGT
jgi:hypothetical protein